MKRWVSALLLIAAVAAITGCASYDKKNPLSPGGGGGIGGSTIFTGLFTGPTTSGKVSITVSTTSLARALRAPGLHSATVTATGTITPTGGSSAAVAGSYDPATNLLSVTGGGYSIAAFYDPELTPPGLTGTFVGPTESGNVLCVTGSDTNVGVYCGSYENSALPPTEFGSWNFIVSGDNLVGYAWPLGAPETLYLSGTVTGTGSTRTITVSSSTPDFTLNASGTLDTGTNAVSGTWDTIEPVTSNPLDSGAWSGALCP